MANIGPDNVDVMMAKDFLSVLDLSSVDLGRLLDLARQMKADRRFGRQAPTASALAGRHVAMLFEKPSLRTRSTFEIAVKELGAETLHVPSEFADGTREPLDDVARNLERWVHALVVRTYAQEKAASMGMGLSLPPLFDFILAGVAGDEVGSASGVLNAIQQFGSALGIAVLATIFFAYVDHGHTSATAMTNTTLLSIVPLALATLAVFRLPHEARAVAV